MTRQPKVSIVIVGYNAVEWLQRCLGAVLDGSPAVCDSEVIVVDNASTPPLADQLGQYRGRIRLVTMRENVGFGNACNVGRELATGTHILLLNPDAIVLPGAIDALLRHLEEQPGRGIVGGRTVTPSGATDPRSCWGQPSWWSQFCFATGLSTLFHSNKLLDPESLGRWQRDTEREVGVVTGCLLLASLEVWDELGGFDPDFFMYSEDVDLSRRAIALGYHPSITPQAEAVHAWGASSTNDNKIVMVMRGKATFFRKQDARIARWLSAVLLIGGVALRAALERLIRRPQTWTVAWQRRAEWVGGWPRVPCGEIPRLDPRFIANKNWDLA